jgi:hypothetical protein
MGGRRAQSVIIVEPGRDNRLDDGEAAAATQCARLAVPVDAERRARGNIESAMKARGHVAAHRADRAARLMQINC